MSQYSFEALSGEYKSLWSKMSVVKVNEANAEARLIVVHKQRYKAVEKTTGVPWFVIGCLHMRESGGRFDTWLHNGDRMHNENGFPVRTVNVPANRPPNPNVSWEEGAYDALVVCEQLDLIKDWGPERVAYAAEKFNGFGYRYPSRNIPSPYLWGGTSIQKRGKFIRDNVYDANEMDPQLGAMAVLKQLIALDSDARFVTTKPPSVPTPLPRKVPAPQSPRADDGQSQVGPPTRGIWGGVISWVMGNGGVLATAFDRLDNPWALAALCAVLVFTSIGLYLIISGRINAAAIIRHLARDDSQDAAIKNGNWNQSGGT